MNLKKLSWLGLVLIAWTVNSIAAPKGDYAFRYWKLLQPKEQENFVFSPYSIHLSLGLTASGARGKTQRQLGGGTPDLWTQKKDAPYKLFFINRLWIQSGVKLFDKYLTSSDQTFGVRPWFVDFSKAHDFLKNRINSWIEEKTIGRLKNSLGNDEIEPTTQMILTSGLFFRGIWANPFAEKDTHEDLFESKKVPFLTGKGTWNYLRPHAGLELIELPYGDGELSLIIAFPHGHLGSFEQSLRSEQWNLWLNELKPTEISLELPKLEWENRFSLDAFMKDLGVEDAFQPEKADFQAMANSPGLYLRHAYHHMIISFTEGGTEAVSDINAAISRSPASSSGHPIQMKINSPFWFSLIHKPTRAVIAMGHIVKL